jgi:hypothetical protein
MGQFNKKGDKYTTSIVISRDVHRRIRELTGFDQGGFTHLIEVSLSVLLPLVESYNAKHKRISIYDNILQLLADDSTTEFDYEKIGREFVSTLRKKTKEVF